MERRAWVHYIVAASIGAVVALVAVAASYKNADLFSPHQPLDTIVSEYQRCKANAPTGFDCVMVPMVVSEQFMKEEL